MEIVLMIFPQRTILDPKMAHPQNSGSALTIFSNRYMEIVLMAFPKKILFGGNGAYGIQDSTSSQLWIRCKECFTVLQNEVGQELNENFVSHFPRKNLTWGILMFLGHFLLFDWIDQN